MAPPTVRNPWAGQAEEADEGEDGACEVCNQNHTMRCRGRDVDLTQDALSSPTPLQNGAELCSLTVQTSPDVAVKGQKSPPKVEQGTF